VSAAPIRIESSTSRSTAIDATHSAGSSTPIRCRHKASTVAGSTLKTTNGEPHGSHSTVRHGRLGLQTC
jgi:hypothetical protein